MSEQRKASSSKKIKKLQTSSMVCSLTRSWQQWVTDNEDKQASEPSGWSPSSGGPAEEPIKPWGFAAAAKAKAFPKASQPTAVSPDEAVEPSKPQETSNPHQKSPAESETGADVDTAAVPMATTCIKTKPVVKTVTNGNAAKGAAIGLPSRWSAREVLPPAGEIDRLLNKRSSPTRRRKCANVVSSLTKSWKEVEKERKPASDGCVEEGRTCPANNEVDRGHSGAGEKVLDQDGEQTFRNGSFKETDNDLPERDAVSAIKIKRPSAAIYKKDSEDAIKINALSKKYSAVCNLKSRWQNWALEHTVNQKLNPFSEEFDYEYSMSLRLRKGEDGYGRPKDGTKTAERAKRAERHIHREIDDMCYVIRTMADPDRDGVTRVTFGQLFDRYVRISDKVVGILMRARKHGKVAFEGEMLWQGRDDGVVITLLV